MEEHGPAVSIVLCVYNGRDFLDDIVGFIERQTFQDYELLFVVDIRCDDGSSEFIEDYCSNHEKARFVMHDVPTKLGGAKNIGMDASRGRYLWFLDVDDVPSKDFLKVMVEAKESTGADLALCNFQYTDNRNWKSPGGDGIFVMSGKTALHARSLNIIPVTSWAMLYDKENITANGIRFREMMAEDIAFTYLALDAADKVCYVSYPLYGYYQNEKSFCKNNADERGISELENYIYLSERFPENNWYLQNRFCLIGLRSLTHMTSKGFRLETKDGRLKDYVKEHLLFVGKMEYRFIRLFPRIYYSGVSWYIRNFYCRTGKIYTDCGKMRTLKKIVDNSNIKST